VSIDADAEAVVLFGGFDGRDSECESVEREFDVDGVG